MTVQDWYTHGLCLTFAQVIWPVDRFNSMLTFLDFCLWYIHIIARNSFVLKTPLYININPRKIFTSWVIWCVLDTSSGVILQNRFSWYRNPYIWNDNIIYFFKLGQFWKWKRTLLTITWGDVSKQRLFLETQCVVILIFITALSILFSQSWSYAKVIKLPKPITSRVCNAKRFLAMNSGRATKLKKLGCKEKRQQVKSKTLRKSRVWMLSLAGPLSNDYRTEAVIQRNLVRLKGISQPRTF